MLGISWGYIFDEERENTWLNGVVPAWKILDLLDSEPMKHAFEAAELSAMNLKKNAVATPSVAVEDMEPPTTGDNPDHREAFNRLLGAAVSKPKSDQGT